MKFSLGIFLMFIICYFSCSKDKIKIVDYNELGEKIVIIKDTVSNSEQITIFHVNGNIKEKFHKINDTLNGKYYEYYDSGKVKQLANYENGLASGQLLTYYRNGNVKGTYEMDSSCFNGFSKEYDEMGELKMVNLYKENHLYFKQEYDDKGRITNYFFPKIDLNKEKYTYNVAEPM